MKISRIYRFLLLLTLSATGAFAQLKKVELAHEYLVQGKLDSAKATIDVAIQDPETAGDFQSWYVKGFIYKEIFKQRETNNVNSPSRDIAVEALKKSIELNTEKQDIANLIQNLKFLGSKYNNDALKLMDTVNYTLSESLFEKYLSVYKICDPAFVEKTKRLEYYLALSTKFHDAFELTNSDFTFELTKKYFEKALSIDPNSAIANKNYAVLYYNMGVNIIKRMDYDVDLEQLYTFQDQATKLFKQAEPYMLKAYSVSPKDKIIVEGLQGIYYQLNETEKSNEYKKILEELNK